MSAVSKKRRRARRAARREALACAGTILARGGSLLVATDVWDAIRARADLPPGDRVRHEPMLERGTCLAVAPELLRPPSTSPLWRWSSP